MEPTEEKIEPKDQFGLMIKIAFFIYKNKNVTVSQIKKEFGIHREQIDRILRIYRAEGILLEEIDKKDNRKKFLKLDREKLRKKYDDEVFKNWAMMVVDVLAYFYKDKLNEKTTVKKIIKELEAKHKVKNLFVEVNDGNHNKTGCNSTERRLS